MKFPNIIKKFVQPITFTVNFRDSMWDITSRAANLWLVGVITAGVLALATVGFLNVITVFLTAVTPVLLWVKATPRFIAAAAPLLIVQALGSMAVIYVLYYAGQPYVVREAGGSLWALFSLASSAVLLLKYIRTPRSEMGKA